MPGSSTIRARTVFCLCALAFPFLVSAPSPLAAESRVFELARVEARDPAASGWAILDRGALVLEDQPGRIIARDLESGRTRWRHVAEGGFVREVIRRGGELVVVSRDLAILDLATGRLLWRFPLGCQPDGTCDFTPAWVGARGALLTGFGDARDAIVLVDFDARGDLWAAPAVVGRVGAVAVDAERVLVVDPQGRSVVALDAATGTIAWRTWLGRTPFRTLRLWSDAGAVHVLRAPLDGGGTDRIDTLDAATGVRVRRLAIAPCRPGVASCGVRPVAGGVLVWDAPAGGRSGVGHVVLHDFSRGETPLDIESYLVAPPVVVDERTLVVAERHGKRVQLRAYGVPDGALRWRRSTPGLPPAAGGRDALLLAAGEGGVVTIAPATGLVTGLSAEDGSVTGFGLLELPVEALAAMEADVDGVTIRTRSAIVALRARPTTGLSDELRDALADGDGHRVRVVDTLAVRLARDLPGADATHGAALRHALLVAYHEAARGVSPPSLEGARERLDATPAGHLEPVLTFARALHDLLADWILDEPDDRLAAIGPALEGLADAWIGRLGHLEEPLLLASTTDRTLMRAAGIDLAVALVRAGRSAPAVRLLAALDGAPIALFASDLPGELLDAVARDAVETAREAAQAVRLGQSAVAVRRLEDAARVPFGDSLFGFDDRLRRRILDLRFSGGVDSKELAALAGATLEAWETAARRTRAGEGDCVAACARRRVPCERPCVSARACDDAHLGCVSGCRTSGEATWAAPTSLVPPDDRAYALRCL